MKNRRTIPWISFSILIGLLLLLFGCGKACLDPNLSAGQNLLCFLWYATGGTAPPGGGGDDPLPGEILRNVPLTFEANHGQAGKDFQFLARGAGYNMMLSGSGAVLDLRKAQGGAGGVLGVKIVGANPNAHAEGLERLPGKVNYFLGSDPKHWYADIETYSRVQFRDVYPGINVVYYGKQLQLENDFVVAPGADPRVIQLAFDGVDEINVDSAGDLVLATEFGDLRWHKPSLYQAAADGGHRSVEGKFVLKSKGRVGFEVGRYDTSRPLVLDPVLTYSTFYGRTGNDAGRQIAVDSTGNVYVAGISTAALPTTGGAVQAAAAGSESDPFSAGDAFILKLNASGTAVIYATYLGGKFDDAALGIAVDSAGNAYVSGFTRSPDFPTTTGAFQTTYGGADINTKSIAGGDAFVTKLNAAGNQLVYSTYLGGQDVDQAWAIAVDAAGNAYVTGATRSKNFPTTNGAFQTSYKGDDPNILIPSGDAFVTKLNATGSGLVYSTYLGGSSNDRGQAIAVDAGGNAYITGATASTNFPTTGGVLQVKYGGSGGEPTPASNLFLGDAFVTKLNPAGTAAVYSTYLGGSKEDIGLGIAVDSSGFAYVTGGTISSDFPVTGGALRTKFGGAGPISGQAYILVGDAFVAKLNPGGTALVYSTYLGGAKDDLGHAIVVDSVGNAYVTGSTLSADFPVTADALQSKFAGSAGQPALNPGDAFVVKLNPAGTALLYSTFLGGEADDVGVGLAIDGSSNMYVTGNTMSLGFPVTPGAPQGRYGGGRGGKSYPQGDMFVARIGDPIVAPAVTVAVTPAAANLTASKTQQFTATVTNATNVAVTWSIKPADAGSISPSGLYSAPAFIAATQTVTVTATSAADPTKSASATVTLNPTPPAFTAAAIVNAASLLPGPVTAGMIVMISGDNFGPSAAVQGSPSDAGVLGTILGDTRALFDGKAAPLVAAAPGKITAIVPYAVAGSASTRLQIEYKGVQSPAVVIPVTDAAPALFAADGSGQGQGLILNADSTPNSAANAANIGDAVTLQGTGEGQTDPPGADGKVAADAQPVPLLPVSVTIGGVDATLVSAAVGVGQVAGNLQVTVKIPDGVGPGDVAVVVTVGTASSQAGITVAVNPPPQ